ncbi:tetratricopeptide repeat protein [Desulfonatronovibrio magnus]|uniref:tetratricopeptide repeat protein n=1 Tax=Desulfonatronovibrio magnus TaxID=698827 RepID=UPI0005EAEF4C|nr:tetratricopeptide repeat protein [Desulfonatronovibrio magnus]
MSTTRTINVSRRNLYLGLFVFFWIAFALGAIFWVRPDVLRDPYAHYQKAEQLVRQGQTESALAEMEKAVSLDPDNPGYLTFKGSLALEVFNPFLAEASFEKALNLEPDNVEAVLGLARSLMDMSRPEEASKVLTGLSHRHMNLEQLERRAGMLAQNNQHVSAVHDFEILISHNPANPKYRIQAASSYMAMGLWVQAAEHLQVYLNMDISQEDNLHARQQLTMALQNMGELEKTFEVLSSNPTQENLRERADLAMQMQLFDQATGLYQELIKAGHADEEIKNSLAIALRASGKLAPAYELFARFPSPENLRARAQLAMQLEKFGAAEEYYSELIVQEPVNREFANNLAIALRAMGKPDQAYEYLSRFPDQDNLRARAELALELGRYSEATEMFKTLAAGYPSDFSISEALAYAAQRSEDTEDSRVAREEYKRIIDSGRAGTQTRVRYAWLLMREQQYNEAYDVLRPLDYETLEIAQLKADSAFLAGKLDMAIAHLNYWLMHNPGDADRWRNLADAYDASQQPDQTIDALERYIELKPGDRVAGLRLAGLYQRTGRTQSAITQYRKVMADHPGYVEAFKEASILFESEEMFEDAVHALERVAALQEPEDYQYMLRLARNYRWAGLTDRSLKTYRQVIHQSPATEVSHTAKVDIISILIDQGRPEEARDYLDSLDAIAAHDPELVLLEARAAMLEQDPQRAVQAFDRLHSLRGLVVPEKILLAGQLRSLGDTDRALALLEEVSADLMEAGDEQSLEALGDLRLDAGLSDQALEAYLQISGDDLGDSLLLKIARSANQAGEMNIAMQYYLAYLDSVPADNAIMLEAARFFVSAGLSEQALGFYQQAIDIQGEEGLRLEMALASLAAQEFAHAEKWASKAVENNEGEWRAVLALAQALHLQGKSGRADRLLRDHEEQVMEHPEGREWMGYVAVARDRHLQAFNIFDELIQEGWRNPGNLWLWRGIAATRRGDMVRADESFQKAQEYGQVSPDMHVYPELTE